MPAPTIYLARHGETEWALIGKHTGRTDIALTDKGVEEAKHLGERLKGLSFKHVFTSPLQRARRTSEVAGFGSIAQEATDLLEWHYGQFEGLKTAEIRKLQPGWSLFRDGCPGGEAILEIADRADRLLNRLKQLDGPILLFAHGHILRVLAARFLEQDVLLGKCLHLGTAAVCILGYDHPPDDPAIYLWNDRRHLEAG